MSTLIQSSPVLTIDTLVILYTDACLEGAFGDALKAADALSQRDSDGRDLALPDQFPAMKGYSPNQLQIIGDRIEQFNASC